MSQENFNEITHSELERLPLDIERVHLLADDLLPVFGQIQRNEALDDEALNQKLVELMAILHELHPADMATLLESLPQKERVIVWKLAEPEDDGDVLLEVSDAVRETLIESMDKEELLAAQQILRDAGIENSTTHLTGQSVGDALIRYAEENAVDLIVMGAYGHSRLRQFFIGSHTSEMLQKTQQPLLILR